MSDRVLSQRRFIFRRSAHSLFDRHDESRIRSVLIGRRTLRPFKCRRSRVKPFLRT
jgi:hypothetical protein